MTEASLSSRHVESSWRALASLYRAVIRTSILNHLQYRVKSMIEIVLMLGEPVVYLVVWQIVARENGGSIDGYTAGRFAAYFIAFSLVRTLTQTGSPHNWERFIKDGRMSTLLLRPIHPVHQDLGSWVGFAIVRAVMWIPAGVVLVIAFRPDVHIGFIQIPVFVVAVSMAFTMRNMVSVTIGAIAFWVTRIGAIAAILTAADLLTSGRLVPIEVMPGWAQVITRALPYRWMFAFPVEVLIGPISSRSMLTGLGMQVLWFAIIWTLLRLIWRRGIRHYSAVGG